MRTVEVQAPGSGESVAGERRILLIEDSAVLTRRLIDLLSEPGRIEVAAQATTQSEAVSRLQQGAFDVLVVDIELAEGNGVAVIRAARQMYPPDAQPLIVVLTNYASDFVRDHCFAAGAGYFLDKIRDIALLKAVLRAGPSKWTPPHPSHGRDRGTATLSVVPTPTLDLISRCPPMPSARWRMPHKTCDQRKSGLCASKQC